MSKDPTILIVEDDEGHAILIRQNLEGAGLENRIEHFRDGQAILDFFFDHRHQADETYLILLDIRMPKVDGIEVLRRLKAHPEFRKLPVIMLTTTDDTREIERCHQLGCSGYIQKPVDYDKFAEAIRRIGLFVPLLLVPSLGTT
ncbi:MAG TPA: response regulator [Opitutaceae bacterium]|nr:response regulator [Opitutaceae bacterium]